MNEQKPVLLLIGCGDLATALGQSLLDSGWTIYGARRQPRSLPEGFIPVCVDVADPKTLSGLSAIAAEYCVITLSPGERSESAYRQVFEAGIRNILAALNRSQLKRLLFTSSTSVYHQNDGRWVDENSETAPQNFSGRGVLQAEQQLRESGVPVTIIRYGGIYGGPGGNLRMLNRVRAGRCAAPEPVHFSNRIHRDDCVAVLRHLLLRAQAGETVQDCYLAVDSEPAPIAEVHQWMAGRAGVDYAIDAHYQHMGGSKRCSNKRLLETGFRFRYPDFRTGYSAVIGSDV